MEELFLEIEKLANTDLVRNGVRKPKVAGKNNFDFTSRTVIVNGQRKFLHILTDLQTIVKRKSRHDTQVFKWDIIVRVRKCDDMLFEKDEAEIIPLIKNASFFSVLSLPKELQTRLERLLALSSEEQESCSA